MVRTSHVRGLRSCAGTESQMGKESRHPGRKKHAQKRWWMPVSGEGCARKPLCWRGPAGWVGALGRATPQAWHLLERLECGQETEESPGAKNIPQGPVQGSLECWLRAQAEAPSSLGLILASPLTSCVATGQLHHLSRLSVSVGVVGIIIASGRPAA